MKRFAGFGLLTLFSIALAAPASAYPHRTDRTAQTAHSIGVDGTSIESQHRSDDLPGNERTVLSRKYKPRSTQPTSYIESTVLHGTISITDENSTSDRKRMNLLIDESTLILPPYDLKNAFTTHTRKIFLDSPGHRLLTTA